MVIVIVEEDVIIKNNIFLYTLYIRLFYLLGKISLYYIDSVLNLN